MVTINSSFFEETVKFGMERWEQQNIISTRFVNWAIRVSGKDTEIFHMKDGNNNGDIQIILKNNYVDTNCGLWV